VVEDLRNDGGLDSAELNDRLSVRLDDLERVHDDVLRGLGALGSRAASLVDAAARQEDVELELHSRLSKVEDADLAEAALDLARSDMVLQVAQAAGARVIQTTLLDFLG
jgi:flagellar hook-associated protein 3 FlgL